MSTKAWLDSKRQYYLPNSRSTPLQQTTSSTITYPNMNTITKTQLHIGDKVQVNSLHGTVRFIGSTLFKAGTWAGIELDNIGLGKNDGSVDGKRYFICPPNTGIFILAIKVIKQQHYLPLHNRPSTPHKSTINHHTKNKPRPPLPISTNNSSTTKKIIISPTTPTITPTLTPIPTPTSTTSISNNNNNQVLLLQKRIEELEIENKSLRQSNEHLEQTVTEIKSASMDSIEILENMIQTHQNTINGLESDLAAEKLKYNKLQQEQNDIKKAGLEAIELTISELETSNKKSEKLIQENESLSKIHHKEIRILLQDINVLENVLQTKMDNEVYLLNSLNKEKQNNNRLSMELKKFGSKNNNINDTRWSFIRERLDTPIQEEDEEEEEDLLDDNILSNCVLCEKKGHDLIHCNIIINQQTDK